MVVKPLVAAPLVAAVLVGLPGAGKSTFAQSLEKVSNRDLTSTVEGAPPRAYVRICQDVLGSRPKCDKRARRALDCGFSVVIDRCNFDQQQRKTWLALPADIKVAVYFDVDYKDALENVFTREAHEGGVDRSSLSEPKLRAIVSTMHRNLIEPDASEGFDRIMTCRFPDDFERARRELLQLRESGQSGCDNV